MKKAKLYLTIVAILTLIGGALAFKANRIIVRFYTPGTTATTTQLVCNSPVNFAYTPDAIGLTTIIASISIDNSNPCRVIRVKVII